MKNIITLLLPLLILSCSPKENSPSTEGMPSYKKICIQCLENKKKICQSASNDLNKDIFELLAKTQLYNVVPVKGKCFGNPGLVITDTLGGKVIDTIKNFHMDDYYYYQYEYNKEGLIKKYSYIDDVNPEPCIEVSYQYDHGTLVNVLAINPHQYTSTGKTISKKNKYVEAHDTLYSVELKYKENEQLNQIKITNKKDKLTYEVIYNQ